MSHIKLCDPHPGTSSFVNPIKKGAHMRFTYLISEMFTKPEFWNKLKYSLTINLHNVTHFLISRNPRERMFVVQISLLIVTFLSLISRNLSLMQTTQEVNPHPRIMPCVNMWSVTFLFFFFLCCLLNVGACIRHIAGEGQVKWTTLA